MHLLIRRRKLLCLRRGGVHVHVRRAGGHAKFWMDPLSLDSARGLKTQELVRAEQLAAEHADAIREKWHEVFGR